MAGQIERWAATLATASGDEVVTSEQVDSFERVNERGGCHHLEVWVEGRAEPLRVAVDDARHDEIRMFTRRAVKDAMTPSAHMVEMPVLEVCQNRHGHAPIVTRLYVHPEHGLVLSTLDLNL